MSEVSGNEDIFPVEWESDTLTPCPLCARIRRREGAAPAIRNSSVWQPESLVQRQESVRSSWQTSGLVWTITVRSRATGDSSESKNNESLFNNKITSAYSELLTNDNNQDLKIIFNNKEMENIIEIMTCDLSDERQNSNRQSKSI